MGKTIKNILISQNAPADMEQSQYKLLIDKYNLNLEFNKFFEVVKISNKEYRAQRINLLDYSAVIMTSKLAVDHYFLFAKEMRIVIPDDMKFFCITDSIANYLQTYIQYRKRKIFYGKLSFDELITVMQKHSDEKYLFPCAEDASPVNFKKLTTANLNYTKIIMYRSKPKKLTGINIKKYDMVVLFSPVGVKSFLQNFQKITSDDIAFAAFGRATVNALQKAKLKVIITAPTVKSPSMIMALDHYFDAIDNNATAKSEKILVAKPTVKDKLKKNKTTIKKTVKKAEPKISVKEEKKTVATKEQTETVKKIVALATKETSKDKKESKTKKESIAAKKTSTTKAKKKVEPTTKTVAKTIKSTAKIKAKETKTK